MKWWWVCLHPRVFFLITDPVSRGSPPSFSILSPKHMTTCGSGGGGKGADIYWADWWLDFSDHVIVIDVVLRWRNWGLVARLMELSCSLLPPGSPSDSLSRLTSGPCSWDLLCEGAGHSEYLPGTLPMLTGASDLATHFSEGVVDAVGRDWVWVPWGLH